MHGGISLRTDIEVSFERLGISFADMLDDKKGEMRELAARAIADFDFEGEIRARVHAIILGALSEAISGVDLSDEMQAAIGKEIRRRLGDE